MRFACVTSALKTRQKENGVTIIELIVVIVVVVILAGMILPSGPRGKANPLRIQCVNNLKNVGLAYRIYATDNQENFPWERMGTNAPSVAMGSDRLKSFLAITNQLSTPKILICPADNRKESASWSNFTSQNLSYFVSPDASQSFPESFLSGDRNICSNGVIFPRGRVKIPHSAVSNLSWTKDMHNLQGNACMGDGSVQQLSSARLRDQWRNQGGTNSTTTLLFP
jgi:type II secretory pathway pseudopilin PulG